MSWQLAFNFTSTKHAIKYCLKHEALAFAEYATVIASFFLLSSSK